MVNHICEFCKKIFTTKGNLITHQKSAKYCISIRNESLPTKYTCTYCDKDFVPRCFDNHMKNCTVRKEKENISLKSENQSLKIKIAELETTVKFLMEEKKRSQSCIEEIAKQPKTTTNKTIIEIEEDTPEEDKESLGTS